MSPVTDGAELRPELEITPDLLTLVAKAGESVLKYYSAAVEVQQKIDGSPLTAADLASNAILLEGLKKFGLPILSEEEAEAEPETRLKWTQYFLIDPLDGTLGFLEKNGEFAINIACIRNNLPVLGIIYHPVTGTTFYAKKGEGAFRMRSGKTEKLPLSRASNAKMLASRNDNSPDLDDYIQRLGTTSTHRMHSSMKFCLIAEGSADYYVRIKPSMEWDVAAGQIIVEEAGGYVCKLTGEPLTYNSESLINPSFIACSAARNHDLTSF